MGLHSIDDQGNLEWRCPHHPEHLEQPCGTVNTAHISHEYIKWHGHPGAKPEHRTVSLPPCPGCGAVTFLKVAFTERELNAPNMWLEWNSQRAQALVDCQKAYKEAEEGSAHQTILAHQIQQLEAIRDANGLHTPTHAVAMRHVELARQLIASGKVPEQGDSDG